MAAMHARAGLARRVGLGLAGVLALAVFAAGCSDDASPVVPDPGVAPRPQPEGPNADDTGVTPVTRRIGLEFQVSGALRPGTPVVVTTIARARRQAESVRLEVDLLDEADTSSPGAEPGRRAGGRFTGPMGRGAEHRVSETFVFSRPGLYRVNARALSTGPQTEPLPSVGDSLVVNASYETLYLLVDENGGRVMRGYEPGAAGAGRAPLFGSYGPFVATRTGAGAARSVSAAPGAPRRQSAVTKTFYFQYDNQDTGARSPIAGAEVEITCLDASYNPLGSPLYPTIAADGSFTVSCSGSYFDGVIRLRDIYSEVLGEGRATAGVGYFWEGSSSYLLAANPYAAHVFVTLRRYVPTAESRFGNRWRQRLPVLVHSSDASFPIHYEPTQDTMRTNYMRVFNEDGRFVTMHEYGHAYHHRAIERWANYYCSPPPGTHHTHLPYTLSCAFVEGFATFFAVWMVSNELSTGQHTDNGIETQTFYTTATGARQDGVLIEGSVAGFLYDLVDGSSERDNTANNAAYEETWDTAVYPGSFIADIMANCAPYQTGTNSSGQTTYTYTYYLDGADQLVYCMEGNVSAETFSRTWSTAWRTTWDGVTRSPNFSNPTGYSTTLVRTLWKRNFYGAP